MNLSKSETRLMEIIWSDSPVNSGVLAAKALRYLGWKKSTVYTVLKKLCLKGAVSNENAVIKPLCSREEVMDERSGELISSGYSGSLPMFLTAFLKKEKLTKKEAEELKKLIDDYTDGEAE